VTFVLSLSIVFLKLNFDRKTRRAAP